ncbi:MAG: type I-MYXAN CRISPR-associated endonuclease Cas1 [Myxococcota bacterium]
MDTSTIRVMGLHSLTYCERLYYLEEVEGQLTASDRVYAGRRLHQELEEDGDLTSYVLESEELGLRGKIDAFRRRDGEVFAVEHKRGRSRTDGDLKTAWDADVVQVAAYAMMLEEVVGRPVNLGRVRYHADNTTVTVVIDEKQRAVVRQAVLRARELAESLVRPAVVDNPAKCVRCSLAPVCLPEESRFLEEEGQRDGEARLHRVFTADAERRSVHVVDHDAKVGRTSSALRITRPGKEPKITIGVREVSDLTIHGNAQVTTQALHLCALENIPVHYLTRSGAYQGAFTSFRPHVQRRLRQYAALNQADSRLSLARLILMAKVELQLRSILRRSRGKAVRETLSSQISGLRSCLRSMKRCDEIPKLVGFEGRASRWYFEAYGALTAELDPLLRFDGRNRRPPRDRANALLSFGYSLLFREVLTAILRVGLDPAIGIVHRPRSQASPLALDIVELFRVILVDVPVAAALSRSAFNVDTDFEVSGERVWLSGAGRKKAIEVFERRKSTKARHPVLGYSLSYARMIELEVRLLEKEWANEPGLFARFRLR